MAAFHFPRWTNHLFFLIPAGAIGGVVFAVVLVTYGFSPKTLAVGYAPEQPVPFSHKLHAGDLGMDCRYCHNTVERAAHAAIPPTATCMNCHEKIHADSPHLEIVRDSAETGEAVNWVRVHDIADYAYFDHSAHVNRGIGCVSCHGRIDQMEIVTQQEPLSMGWCLECHRNPQPHLRPLDRITDMDWQAPEGGVAQDDLFYDHTEINPQETCSTCHR